MATERYIQELARLVKLSKHEYAPTQYDKDGKLLDDCLDKENEKSYFECFLEPKVAREVENRLRFVSHPDYIPGSVQFKPIKEDDDA